VRAYLEQEQERRMNIERMGRSRGKSFFFFNYLLALIGGPTILRFFLYVPNLEQEQERRVNSKIPFFRYFGAGFWIRIGSGQQIWIRKKLIAVNF
jgi:hypothetical protein